MQLTEIGAAAWAAAIGFLILGSSPPPEIEASARPGGDVDPPLPIGAPVHSGTSRIGPELGDCQGIAALSAPLPSGLNQHPAGTAPTFAVDDRKGVESFPDRISGGGLTRSVAVGCPHCPDPPSTGFADIPECPDRHIASLSLKF